MGELSDDQSLVEARALIDRHAAALCELIAAMPPDERTATFATVTRRAREQMGAPIGNTARERSCAVFTHAVFIGVLASITDRAELCGLLAE